jgi:hypothetical protein
MASANQSSMIKNQHSGRVESKHNLPHTISDESGSALMHLLNIPVLQNKLENLPLAAHKQDILIYTYMHIFLLMTKIPGLSLLEL